MIPLLIALLIGLFRGAVSISVRGRCPPGFEVGPGGSCFAFAAGPTSHTAAMEVCESYASKLACPTNQEELDYISNRARNDGRDYWIGLSDVLHEVHREPSLPRLLCMPTFSLYPTQHHLRLPTARRASGFGPGSVHGRWRTT